MSTQPEEQQLAPRGFAGLGSKLRQLIAMKTERKQQLADAMREEEEVIEALTAAAESREQIINDVLIGAESVIERVQAFKALVEQRREEL